MTVATARATGTRGMSREGRVRFAFTLDEVDFAEIKNCAVKNRRTVAEEIRLRLTIAKRNESTDTGKAA